MRRGLRPIPAAVLLVLVAAALLLSACGDDDGPNTKIDTARLAQIDALTPEQYTAIKKVFVAALAFDDLGILGSLSQRPRIDAMTRTVRRACDGLDEDDALLGALRASCPQSAANAASDAVNCPGDRCGDVFDRARARTRLLVAYAHRADAAVAATHLPRACKRALTTTTSTYRRYDRLDHALVLLERALLKDPGDEGAATAGVSALLDVESAGAPTAQQALDRLRRGCH